ncbi:tetratricopeptide repeat-containing sensor histidine kinase [Rufibacter psychrotolerans]|uniref:tetratricopeptide repeat-containing sensor histidine kinase n=1 Tax=Rufibacter psychrotolerans TaxID=2812556 RepID=UPI0019674893|nr:ATP-binding protein [Rufibacter sp. SYSU D00308]
MKVAIYLVLFVFLQWPALAAGKQTDRSPELLPARADSARVQESLKRPEAYSAAHPRKALHSAAQALQQALARKRLRKEALSLRKLGLAHVAAGSYPKASRCFEQAVTRFTSLGDLAEACRLLNTLGSLYGAQGHEDQALPYYQRALALACTAGNPTDLAQTLNHLGILALKKKQAAQALEKFTQAQHFAKEAEAAHELREAYAGMAQAYGQLSDFKRAFQYHSLLLALQQAEAPPGTKPSLAHLPALKETAQKQVHLQALPLGQAWGSAGLGLASAVPGAWGWGATFLVGTAALLLLAVRTRERALQLLRSKNSLIKAQRQELTTQRTRLEKARRKLEKARRKLARSKKMASFGQLTAGVAHEINNPINYVSAGIDSLRVNFSGIREVVTQYLALKPGTDTTPQLERLEKLKQELELETLLEESSQLLNSVRNGASLTKEIVKSLKTFTHGEEAAPQPVNLHDSLDAALVILSSQLRDRIRVQRFYGDLPEIACFPGQLQQVFLNLLCNAAQAIKGEGTITITTGREEDHATITIADTGEGMPEEVMQQIFEPFFTTKKMGEGTGLGLAITRRIIEHHRGKISVASQWGTGTCFTIWLPLTFPASGATTPTVAP